MQRQEVSCIRVHDILLLAVLLLQTCVQLATSGTTVHYLPGFDGPLPFDLETGYVGVGESEDVQVFYYFIKSEKNPKEDPVMLWITGGPSCSSFSSLVYEIGPIAFKLENYKGGMPELELRQQSWTKECSIIFADLPVYSGFSYSKTHNDSQRSDSGLVHHAHEFLRKWLVEHPEYLFNQVYISANSYSGIPIPAIVQEISNGNEKGMVPWINLQGYTLGNPITTWKEINDHAVSFAHGMGLVSDELYMSLQKNCRKNIDSDSQNVLCSRDLEYLIELLSGINLFHILEPHCEMPVHEQNEVSWRRRSLSEKFNEIVHSHLTLLPTSCQNVSVLSDYWANNDDVRKSLHVRQGSIGKWQRCYTLNYTFEIPNSVEYHANLSKKGYRSLIYSGDHDMVVPFVGTEDWIRALNYSIVDDWRPWLVKDQVAGYTRTYSNQMTYATVKGAGHLSTEAKPEECLAMFNRWISNKPL